jgi:prepilin-type N-terminal cleavage/methylation domain-containing protein
MDSSSTISQTSKPAGNDRGFTLIEMVIALIILFIACMGVFATFAYATKFNRGNSQRSQGLSVLQREVELLRSAKFTPTTVSDTTIHQHTGPACATAPPADSGSRDIRGGDKEVEYRCGIDNNVYAVYTSIDDDPTTPAIDTDSVSIYHPTMKQITIKVIPVGSERWAGNDAVPLDKANTIVATFRRVRAN